MDNIINAQRDTKTFLRTMAMISSIVLVLSIAMSNAYAVPPTAPENCQIDDSAEGDLWQCCWTEKDPADPEQIEIYKCQHCWISEGKVDCSTPDPDPSPFPTRDENISPGDTGVVEQPPRTDEPPIKSGDSVFPNNDGVAEDQQSEEPSIKSNQGVILEERTIDTDSQQNPSSESSNSEQTTSLAKKGNSQNSPVPPECPKQGPIPPDCTMKPKF